MTYQVNLERITEIITFPVMGDNATVNCNYMLIFTFITKTSNACDLENNQI